MARTGVRVTCLEHGETRRHDADYLVSAVSAVMLRTIPVTPALPASKAFAVRNVPYYFDTRVIFQTKSTFWGKERHQPEHGDRRRRAQSRVEHLRRGRYVDAGPVVGTASGAAHPRGGARLVPQALSRPVRGHREIAGSRLVAEPLGVGVRDHGVSGRTACNFSQALIEPHGRLHFVGAYADDLNWGMEAATRSANRVEAIALGP